MLERIDENKQICTSLGTGSSSEDIELTWDDGIGGEDGGGDKKFITSHGD